MTVETDEHPDKRTKTGKKTPLGKTDAAEQTDADAGNNDSSQQDRCQDFRRALETVIVDLGRHEKSTNEGISALRIELDSLLKQHKTLQDWLKAQVLAKPTAAHDPSPAEPSPTDPSPTDSSPTESDDDEIADWLLATDDKHATPPAPASPAPVATLSRGDAPDWARIVMGDSLASDATIADQRSQLIEGLIAGDAAATSLVGQLMIFNTAPTDRLPKLLGDVGEAFYRWQAEVGQEMESMRDALIDRLGERCHDTGVTNKIELVLPGDRFEPIRHNSKQPGIEVTEVYGWIVLRDNGKVYTRASVAAK